MISWDDYFKGHDKECPKELTDDIIHNGLDTIAMGNKLLEDFGEERRVNSGWRPALVNANVKGAAKGSKHLLALAIDFEDKNRKLCAFLTANDGAKLIEHGLYMEDPIDTPIWCHVSKCPPKSGKRIYRR